MIQAETPFPHVGSFALLIDDTLPIAQQRAELARILERNHSTALIALPLRHGAGGQKRVPHVDLIDGTPLSREEECELDQLRLTLQLQVRPKREKVERSEALRKRQIYSKVLSAELAKLRRFEARQQPSIGQPIPRAA